MGKQGDERPVCILETHTHEIGPCEVSNDCSAHGTTQVTPVVDATTWNEADEQIEQAGLRDGVEHPLAPLTIQLAMSEQVHGKSADEAKDGPRCSDTHGDGGPEEKGGQIAAYAGEQVRCYEAFRAEEHLDNGADRVERQRVAQEMHEATVEEDGRDQAVVLPTEDHAVHLGARVQEPIAREQLQNVDRCIEAEEGIHGAAARSPP